MSEGKVVYEIVGDNSKFGSTILDTETKAKGGFSRIKSAGTLAWAAIGTAVVAAGKLMIDITRQAVAEYTKYEQLAEGSKLMFGDAYDYIATKAQNAFRTVGLSQTGYLEQVNKFAIGLKESMGGNEQAAAELADKIVTAEADIVAATGNTQEAVQNAFNGIMRGNYVMLDNLQLGIKPTKAGMQEVIDKVNEWNEAHGRASNYVIDNLADVEAALVDFVEMQGLAGYAAAEALDTIEGSTTAFKASWENLLLALADPNGDIETATTNFTDSLQTMFDNVTPITHRAFFAVLDALGQLIADLGVKIGEGISGIWNDFTTSITTKWHETWTDVGDFFRSKWEEITGIFLDVFNSLDAENQQWLIDTYNQINDVWTDISDFFLGIWETIRTSTIEQWTAISTFFSDTWSAISTTFNTVCNFITGLFGEFGKNVGGVWDGIIQAFNGVITFIRGIFTTNWSLAWQGISNIFAGIANGLKSIFIGPINWIISKVNSFISAINRIKIPDWVPGLGGKGFNIPSIPSLPSYKVGIDYVPNDMFPAFLHKGEAVLTADQAALWRSLGRENGLVNLATTTENTPVNRSTSFTISKVAENVFVRDDSDIDKIAESLYRKIATVKRERGLF